MLENRRAAGVVNARLKGLGIEPLKPAAIDHNGDLTLAVLVEADPGADLNEVRAGWSAVNSEVLLLTTAWDEPRGFGAVLTLHRLGDVAQGRRKSPQPPVRHPDYLATAERSLTALRVDDVTVDTAAVVEAINGLTAAVLYLATRNQQP